MSDVIPPPKGVVCILTDPKGHVWAIGQDFEPGHSVGMTQQRMNEMRAERRCAFDLAKAAIASPVLAGFDGYDVEQLMRRLLGKGWKLHTRPIGFEEGQADG